jgi:hypothetical protein
MAYGIYERKSTANGQLSAWNAQAVLVDKSDNPGPNDEPQVTFNYRNVIVDLPSSYLELSTKVHDCLSHPDHGCYMQFDLKHAYWSISVHPDDRHFFAFTMPGMGQLHPTRMLQGTMSAGHSLTELMNIILRWLSPVGYSQLYSRSSGSVSSIPDAELLCSRSRHRSTSDPGARN